MSSFSTHAHADHIGGNLSEDGMPAFPRARYVLSQPEWHFWMEACDLSSLRVNEQMKTFFQMFAERNLAGVRGQLDLIAPDAEIVPGITAIPAPGHTPGHIALAVESQGETFIDLVDTVLLPVHIAQPDWISAVDWDAEQTVITRRQLIGGAQPRTGSCGSFTSRSQALGELNCSTVVGNGWR